MQCVSKVRAVKKHQRQPPRGIRSLHARNVQPLADARQARRRDDHRLKARRLVGQELRDVEQLRAVLIIAREEGQQIVERVHAQPCKQPRPHGAHPAQRAHRRVKIERLIVLLRHGIHSLLFLYSIIRKRQKNKADRSVLPAKMKNPSGIRRRGSFILMPSC